MLLASLMLPDLHGKNGWPARLLPVRLDMALQRERVDQLGHPQPFSHPDWLYEIKYDGFRALAYCDPSGGRLISRNGNRFSSFADLCAGIESR